MLSYFIHDERYLEIQELMEEFTDMSYGEVQLYESVVSKIRNRDKEKIWDKNQSVMVNVVNLVGRLIKECKNLILKILNSIKNAVDYVFLKKEDKERYAQYEAYLKTHPAYKGKTVTVKDWKKIEKKYDIALKEAETLSKQVASGSISQEEMRKREKTILDDLGDVGTTCLSVMTVDAALRIAKQSEDGAKKIKIMLDHDQLLIEQLEKDLGDKEVAKFRNKIDSLCQQTYFTNLKAKILGKKQKDLTTAVSDTIDEIAKVPTGNKGFLGNLVEGASYAMKNRGMIAKGAKVLAKDKETRDSAKRVMQKGKEIKGTIDGVKQYVKDVAGD